MSYAELANVVRDALELGTGPNADFPMGEYHDKAVAALDNLEEQLEKAKAEAEALREHYTTLVHRHYHARKEAEERLNSAVYEYEKDLAAAEAALQKIEKEAELRSERHIAAIAHRALGGGV